MNEIYIGNDPGSPPESICDRCAKCLAGECDRRPCAPHPDWCEDYTDANHPETERSPGNAAALRDAIQNLCDCTSCDWACIERTGFDPLNETCLRCTGRPEEDSDCPWIQARAALSAPARNCDRYATAKDALDAFIREKEIKSADVDNMNLRDFFDWLFATAEGGKE